MHLRGGGSGNSKDGKPHSKNPFKAFHKKNKGKQPQSQHEVPSVREIHEQKKKDMKIHLITDPFAKRRMSLDIWERATKEHADLTAAAGQSGTPDGAEQLADGG